MKTERANVWRKDDYTKVLEVI